MDYPRNYTRHARLVGQMAEALGVDIEEKVMRSELAPEALDGAIGRCQGCSDPSDCREWLASNTDGAVTPPSYCRNTEFFRLLS